MQGDLDLVFLEGAGRDLSTEGPRKFLVGFYNQSISKCTPINLVTVGLFLSGYEKFCFDTQCVLVFIMMLF